MRERLGAKRGFTHIVAVVVVLGIMTLVSLSSSLAGESKSIEQRVRTAKTPADHKALATFFQKEAQASQRQATRHLQLKEAYAAMPNAQMMVSHCDAIAKHYQEIAKELTSMAEMHKETAAMAR
jgi:cell division protein ZapA (FtsZ GTPase activity inhibitor)